MSEFIFAYKRTRLACIFYYFAIKADLLEFIIKTDFWNQVSSCDSPRRVIRYESTVKLLITQDLIHLWKHEKVLPVRAILLRLKNEPVNVSEIFDMKIIHKVKPLQWTSCRFYFVQITVTKF